MTAKIIHLGLIQMRFEGSEEKMLEKAVAACRDVAAKGANIICLPELFNAPYFCQGRGDKFFKLAESVPGKTTDALSKVAKETKTVILCPIFEKTKEGRYFNSIVVLGTKGETIGIYHKMHIPSLPPGLYEENYYFEKGDGGFPVFDTPYGKIGTLICYDQWFPEGARIAASKGAQILFYPTAIGWPKMDRADLNKAEHEAWQIIQRSHSIANNVFVCAVNRAGQESDINFWGTSFVSDPYGRVLAKASSDKEENLVVKCDLEVIENMRKEWPFLDERCVKVEEC
ncbi:MAG: carbon-nitrogen hydrolase [Patescibacteria group bacterium]